MKLGLSLGVQHRATRQGTPVSDGNAAPANSRLLEDGTSYRLLEDGTSYRLLE